MDYLFKGTLSNVIVAFALFFLKENNWRDLLAIAMAHL